MHFYALLLLVLPAFVLSAITSQPANLDPTKPGHCYFPDREVKHLKKGAAFQDPNCVEVSCGEGSDGKLIVTTVSCGKAFVQEGDGCSLTPINPKKPYPDCCPQITCTQH